MGIKSTLSLPLAKWIRYNINKWAKNPVEAQAQTFSYLLKRAQGTCFGKNHGFKSIRTLDDFQKAVPIRDYEEISHYIDKIIKGEKDVLWPGLPIYFCKTSGTTSGTKYIPISKQSIKHHISAARNALFCYIAATGKADFVDGKMIFLQGSPLLDEKGIVPVGRLSGIVANHVPSYLTKNRMPSFETNCIDDWEAKVDAIVEETITEKMTLISGIPPWVQMYFEKLLEVSKKETIRELFPHFSLMVYGGVNYEPYRNKMEQLIGGEMDTIELYPASEGFIAYQDDPNEEGLLLNLNGGILYEFVPTAEINKPNPQRLFLKDVELGVNYVIILHTDAGLWGYNIGDTVRFVSMNPYRIIVTGRIKHFTSAFGEHVIAEEVEYAIQQAQQKFGGEVVDFHVAPQVTPPNGELPYHEWLIEFAAFPENMVQFQQELENGLKSKNTYYKDLIEGKVLQPLKITTISKNGFITFMKGEGKLGGQNKTPRLANDRKIAEKLLKYC